MPSAQSQNSLVRILRSLGFIDDEQAQKADDALEEHPEADTGDLIVGMHLASPEDVRTARAVQSEQDRRGYFRESLRRASIAAQTNRASHAQVESAARKLIASGVGK